MAQGVIEIEGFEGLAEVYDQVMRVFDTIDYGSILTELSNELTELHRGYFAGAIDPNDTPWPPLSPNTKKKVGREGPDKILVDSGKLVDSLAGLTGDSIRDLLNEGDNQGLAWGTGVDYAHFHATGTKNMPRRAPVGLNEDRVNRLAEAIADTTVGDLTRGF